MKQIIRKIISRFGFNIIRTNRHKTNRHKKDLHIYYELFSHESINNKAFYNVGAGSFSHPFWTNIDYDSEWYAANREKTLSGINYDLLSEERLPLSDETAEIVYSSHTIEHITDQAASFVFKELYRILKRGGIIRLTAPDIDLHYRAFMNNDRYFFYWADWYSQPKDYKRVCFNAPLNTASIEQLFIQRFATSVSTLHADGSPDRISDNDVREMFDNMEYENALNYCTSKCSLDIQRKYPGNHMNWWNKKKLVRFLRKAGFSDIYPSAYGQSVTPILRDTTLFDSTHPKISLYVEGSD